MSKATEYRDPYFWIAMGMTLICFILMKDSLKDSLYHQSPLLRLLGVFLPLALGFFGAYIQTIRVIPGLLISALGAVLLAIIPYNFPPIAGYILVCFHAWYISAHTPPYRRLWLGILALGSAMGITLFWARLIYAPYIYDIYLEASFWDTLSFENISLLIIFLILGAVSIVAFSLWGRQTLIREERLRNLEDKVAVATLVERNRIAREMHDIIAHSLTAIIAQANGGRYAGIKDPDQAMKALGTIGELGRDSLEQMRELLSVLHTGDERRAETNPGLDSIPDLLRQGERDGLSVKRHISGEMTPLPEGKELIIFRFYQESLTNILKYAGNTEVYIEEQWDKEDQELRIFIDNKPGQGLVTQNKSSSLFSSGRGLIGIRERAQMIGGSASWGDSSLYENGWRVQMHIPLNFISRGRE